MDSQRKERRVVDATSTKSHGTGYPAANKPDCKEFADAVAILDVDLTLKVVDPILLLEFLLLLVDRDHPNGGDNTDNDVDSLESPIPASTKTYSNDALFIWGA